ncbi:MAG: hypothetical protein MJ033_04805 [Victivallaceae bacterium]|nr:hypothetical protein [Victivallaceae bacterium]
MPTMVRALCDASCTEGALYFPPCQMKHLAENRKNDLIKQKIPDAETTGINECG